MLRLIPFELSKVWKKRSFILSVCVLLLIHVFLMWYTSLPDESTPPLSAYKAIISKFSDRNEGEKAMYISGLKETLDGVCFVQDILAMQGFQNEMGDMLAKQKMEEQPGRFEKYYALYQSGAYLQFTDSLEQERALVDEIYEQQQKTAGYGEYLHSIQENKALLSEISIFGGPDKEGFSFRNLQKSAADYAHLTDKNIRFTPSKGITSAMEGVWTDLLLFLCVMLFVGGLITEEKEKRLFLITRSTRYGVARCMGAKLAALLIHCTAAAGLFYLISIVFFGQSAGWFEPGAALQSVAAYTESSLSNSIAGYLFLSVMTKAFVLFGAASLLVLLCIRSELTALPFLAGFGIAGAGALCYSLIPAGSVFAILKYLNPVGLMKTENLYGGYLNFNLFGYPVSRLCVSLVLLFLICAAGIVGSVWLFCRMRGFGARKLRLPFSLPFRPHVSIMRHEGYKILLVNHALVFFLLFAALSAYHNLGRTFTPSAAEQYYKDIMKQLEGQLTKEKETLVLAEKKRFDQAIQDQNQMERLVRTGELSKEAADALRAQADMTLSFYPAFQKVEWQYQYVKEHGGGFVYDTGYRYLFGLLDDAFSTDFLLLSVGIVLTAAGAVSMEYQTGALLLLCATKAGKRRVYVRKLLICTLMAAGLALVPLLCRAYGIAVVYPMHSFGTGVRNIACLSEFSPSVPIGLFVLLFALSQIMAAVFISWVVLALSVWRKNQVQTIFFAAVLLIVPVVLKLLGFELAKWFSLYPLYGWTGMLQ